MENVKCQKRMTRDPVLRWKGEKRKSKPARASNYIYSLDEYYKLHPDMKVVFYCRVSAGMQNHKGNLDTHEKILRQKLGQRQIPVVGCFREICSGWVIDEDRWALLEAVKTAQSHNAVIITTSVDRYLRNERYTSDKPDILPTEYEFEKLIKLVDGIPLITLLDPDMSPLKVRGIQTKWGQKHKGNKGGRPRKRQPGYKKRIRLEKLDEAIRLYNEGWTYKKIAWRVNIPISTLGIWIAKYC